LKVKIQGDESDREATDPPDVSYEHGESVTLAAGETRIVELQVPLSAHGVAEMLTDGNVPGWMQQAGKLAGVARGASAKDGWYRVEVRSQRRRPQSAELDIDTYQAPQAQRTRDRWGLDQHLRGRPVRLPGPKRRSAHRDRLGPDAMLTGDSHQSFTTMWDPRHLATVKQVQSTIEGVQRT
jgi:hypothetical protein